ncbi:MAG TPA: tripartite tricarboxylate transporter TctB family protein [Spirochaetales bacterium]|nr:tripartite tricarboxylate transporter TctB family protein [Spirochaetales bacterium]
MHSFLQILKKLDTKIDRTGERLKDRKVNFYPTVVGPIVFLVFALVAFLIMPSQVKVQQQAATTARTFPILLLQIMIVGSVALLVTEIVKILRKTELEVVQIELLTEIKALIILLMLILYAILMPLIGFIPSSLLFSVAMLYFFRIKKVSYYLIIIFSALVIGLIFRYLLGVRLP